MIIYFVIYKIIQSKILLFDRLLIKIFIEKRLKIIKINRFI